MATPPATTPTTALVPTTGAAGAVFDPQAALQAIVDGSTPGATAKAGECWVCTKQLTADDLASAKRTGAMLRIMIQILDNFEYATTEI